MRLRFSAAHEAHRPQTARAVARTFADTVVVFASNGVVRVPGTTDVD
ncbi:MAG: hypothetical protein R3E41_12995 [Burkholderiaceae bacterium]